MDVEQRHRDTLVIGASAGGIDALKRLLPVFPHDLAASVFVVVHIAGGRDSSLVNILSRSTPLPVQFATDGMATQHGCVHFAPPDQHMLLSDEHISLVDGPRENRARPAIDPLFRSAAVQRRARVLGVVLSGLLDDGANGLLAIKRCGGMAMVQHPMDAREPSMPERAAEVLGTLLDGAYPIDELGRRIVHSLGAPIEMPAGVPPDLELEAELLSDPGRSEHLSNPGQLVPLSCPECGGPIRQLGPLEHPRYRCFLGHSYTASTLLEDQDRHVESALWAALRSMEERSSTLLALANQSRGVGRERSAENLRREASQMRAHAQTLRKILLHQETGLHHHSFGARKNE